MLQPAARAQTVEAEASKHTLRCHYDRCFYVAVTIQCCFSPGLFCFANTVLLRRKIHAAATRCRVLGPSAGSAMNSRQHVSTCIACGLVHLGDAAMPSACFCHVYWKNGPSAFTLPSRRAVFCKKRAAGHETSIQTPRGRLEGTRRPVVMEAAWHHPTVTVDARCCCSRCRCRCRPLLGSGGPHNRAQCWTCEKQRPDSPMENGGRERETLPEVPATELPALSNNGPRPRKRHRLGLSWYVFPAILWTPGSRAGL